MHLTPPIRFLLAVSFSSVLLGAATRLLLWAQFGVGSQVALAQVPAILGVGALSDLAQLPWLLLPVALALAALPRDWERPGHRRARFIGLAALVFALLFVGGLEYFFFEEFNARFNLVAVDYLVYPTEVMGNINDTYSVGPLSVAFLAVALLATLAWWPWLRAAPAETRARGIALRGAGLFAVLAGASAALGANAGAVFDNRVANELAANGAARFFSALHTNHLEYPAYYLTDDTGRLRAVLRHDLADGDSTFDDARSGGLSRRHGGRAEGLGKLNIVVLSEESFGAEFVGAYGDVRGLTPEFDALAKQGLLFTHAYATGTRTVRGLEAISASFPPIPSESILKRPGGDHIATWGSVMRELGYETSFLYGGYGTFDNMNAYFRGNGFDISDRTDIPSPRFSNIWGVSDEDLFAHAIDWFDNRAAAQKPFFSIVMSTSNHKPYTFPAGIDGVKPAGGGREAGIRYADHAIGAFFREAAEHAWFKNTLFVVVADHGARVYGAADIPLFSYEIPMLLIAPGRIAPGRIDTATSQMDIAPTVLGLLGEPYEAPFFGQDVLHWAGGPRTLLFNHNHTVAAFRDGHLAILDLNRKVSCQNYQRAAGSARRESDQFTAEPCGKELVELATAYYQVGYELFTQGQYR
ncbi:MAG TPA: LTA synthase family protein [Verrucomicrobiae bacterium]|nr:LTA synthase family protein [Verrucomicrobiae bacterium]